VHCWSDESGVGGGCSLKVLGTVVEVGTALPMAGAAFVRSLDVFEEGADLVMADASLG
jgi:hypothetical protein